MSPATAPRSRLRQVVVALLVALLGCGLALGPSGSAYAGGAAAADDAGASEQPTVVYFFWGDGCPHCAEAEPFLAELADQHPGLEIRAFEVWHDKANAARLEEMAAAYGIEASGVPVIFIGQNAWVGFRSGLTESDIMNHIDACLAEACADPATVDLTAAASGATCGATSAGDPVECDPAAGASMSSAQSAVDVPLLGRVDLSHKSLLVSTLLISFVDGVNPCSLWVLTVLIAMSLRYGSRRRTLLVGGTFIFVTALVYAAFILGLFSVLTIVGFSAWIRVTVAAVAGVMALISIKDYFWFKQGISLTIADDKKPGIYAKMRGVLTHSDSTLALVASTSVLAAGVSLVEFGCTAGFPVLWTNLLSAQQASALTFIALLLVYMVIYQLDEMVIFLTAVTTLRAAKIQEKQGRLLKLGSGFLMLALAVVMIVDPDIMSTVTGAVLVFAVAMGAAGVVVLLDRLIRGRAAAA
ncbi:MAG: thioredoxin family protein [Nocardioidaceae bacterium]